MIWVGEPFTEHRLSNFWLDFLETFSTYGNFGSFITSLKLKQFTSIFISQIACSWLSGFGQKLREEGSKLLRERVINEIWSKTFSKVTTELKDIEDLLWFDASAYCLSSLTKKDLLDRKLLALMKLPHDKAVVDFKISNSKYRSVILHTHSSNVDSYW